MQQKGTPACAYVRSAQCLCYSLSVINTLVNVNAPVVATTSWWLHFTAPVVAKKGKKNLYLLTLSFIYKLAFILFVMTPGAQTTGNIAVYGSAKQLVI